MSIRTKRVLLFFCCAGAALGCQAPLQPEAAREARRSLVAWFECEECADGELEAVLRLDRAVVPTLIAVLERGLSPAERAETEELLRERHAQRVAYGASHPDAAPHWSEARYVAHHLENRDARHRSRAARALGRIGGPEARHALEDALRRDEDRSDVKQSVELALEDLGGTP